MLMMAIFLCGTDKTVMVSSKKCFPDQGKNFGIR